MRQPRTWDRAHLWPGLVAIVLGTVVDLTLDLPRWGVGLVVFTGWTLSELLLHLLRPAARESVQ